MREKFIRKNKSREKKTREISSSPTLRLIPRCRLGRKGSGDISVGYGSPEGARWETRALRRVSGNLRADDSSLARVRKTTVRLRARAYFSPSRDFALKTFHGARRCVMWLYVVAPRTVQPGDAERRWHRRRGERWVRVSPRFNFRFPGTIGDPRVIELASPARVPPVVRNNNKVTRAALFASQSRRRGDDFPSGFRGATNDCDTRGRRKK